MTSAQTDPPADTQTGSAVLTTSLSTEQAEDPSQSLDNPADSQTTGFASSIDAQRGQSLSETVSDISNATAGQKFSSTTSSDTVSSGVPLPEPLEPSSARQVSKVNVGVIAGLVIAGLALVAIFLAFWYRSCRRRQRNKSKSSLSSSFMTSRHNDHDTSGSEAWTQFGGAKGSMIPSPHEEEGEKEAPVFNMFQKRNAPSGPGTSTFDRRSPADRSYSQPLSALANQATVGRLPFQPLAVYEDENSIREDLAPYPPSMLPRKTPAESVYDEYIRSRQDRPESETGLTYRFLPKDMSMLEEGGEGHDLRAASTRAPSLDLAWVTQGDARKSVTSRPEPRKPYSVRSKNFFKSGRNRSTYRHSIMSTLSDPSIGPSASTRTTSSGQSGTTQSSLGLIPDIPSLHSVPAFRLEIGADKANAILQLLVTSPATFTSSEKGGIAEAYTDESRPESAVDDPLRSPNLRDSVST